MRNNRSQIYDTKINIAAYITGRLAEKLEISREEALIKIMKTSTYEMLQDDDIELYLESREHIYEMLIRELDGDLKPLLAVQ